MKHSLVLLLFCGALAGCKPAPAAAPVLPPPLPVGLIQVAPRDLPWTPEYRAEVRASHEAALRPRVSGLVLKRGYREGEAVAAGQVLFEIDPRPYEIKRQMAAAKLAESEAAEKNAAARIGEAEARLAELRVRLAEASREARRQNELVAAEASTRRELDAAHSLEELAKAALATGGSSLEAAKAGRDAAATQVRSAASALEQAQLELSWCSVRAPLAGQTSLQRLEEGSLVSPETELCRISDLRELHCGVLLGETEFRALQAKLAAGQLRQSAGQLKFSLLDESGAVLAAGASLDLTDWQLDPKSQTRILRCVLANPDGRIAPGRLLIARLEGLSAPGVIAVPRHCVFDGPMGKFVYVASAGKDLAGKPALMSTPRPVQAGRWLSGPKGEALWEIRSGLQPGEQIVDEGSAKLRPMPMPVVEAGTK